MNQVQNKKFAMLQATNKYLNDNHSVVEGIPIAGTYRSKLMALEIAIRETAIKQGQSKVYISKSQTELKKSISEFLGITDDSLEVYAEETKNSELLSIASNSVSDYSRLPNEDFEIKVKNMINTLEIHLPEMADYGFSVDQLNTVKVDFNEFQQKRGKPREYKISSKVATLQLKDLFSEVAGVFTKLDKVLRRFKLTNPSFYNGYKASRKVIK